MCVFRNVPFYSSKHVRTHRFMFLFCVLGSYSYSSRGGEECNRKLLYAQNSKAGPSDPQEKLTQLL